LVKAQAWDLERFKDERGFLKWNEIEEQNANFERK
jgi:hypothetical protein